MLNHDQIEAVIRNAVLEEASVEDVFTELRQIAGPGEEDVRSVALEHLKSLAEAGEIKVYRYDSAGNGDGMTDISIEEGFSSPVTSFLYRG